MLTYQPNIYSDYCCKANNETNLYDPQILVSVDIPVEKATLSGWLVPTIPGRGFQWFRPGTNVNQLLLFLSTVNAIYLSHGLVMIFINVLDFDGIRVMDNTV